MNRGPSGAAALISTTGRALGGGSGDGRCSGTENRLMTDTTKPTKRLRRMVRDPQPDSVIDRTMAQAPDAAKAPTKAAQVEALLLREGGASLDDLRQATCWQPHTCRAFLTGLRKKGRVVAKAKREDGVTIYRISSLQASA